MGKFKVGDKVKALVSAKWWRRGDVGLVRKIDDGFRVNFVDGASWWFCNDEESMFELVGPKVYITGGGSGGGAFAGGGGVTLGYGSSRLADALRKDMLLGIGCDSVTIYPNPPHKHKDLIIAWANGADIEFDGTDDGWYNVKYPSWDDTLEYRIKSTKTPLEIKIEKLEAKLAKLKGQL
jgi:hypothetical protein